MNGFFSFLGRIVGVVSMILTAVGFLVLVRQIRKTNRMRAGSLLLSIAFSLLMLFFNILVLNRAPLQWWFTFVLLFGGGFGFAWSKATRLDLREDRIVGQRSILYIYFWLASLVITQLLGLVARTGIVSLGVAAMLFSTGASLGTNVNILYRMKRLVSPSAVSESVRVEKSTTKPEKPSRTRKPGRGLLRAVAVIVGLLVVGFVLVRFVFADKIFPLTVSVGGNPVTLNLAGSYETEVAAGDTNTSNEPVIESGTPSVAAAPQESESQPPEETTEEGQNPKPRQVSPDNLILFEDFANSDVKGRALFTSEYMDFYVAEGLGVIDSTDKPGVLPVMFPDLEVADFIAEFEVMMPEAYDDSAAGMLFRADPDLSDGLDRYYLLYIYPAINRVRMGVWKDEEWKTTDPINPDPPLRSGDAFNVVRVEVKGVDMRLFINDYYVGSYYLETLSDPGLIGLFLDASQAVKDGVTDYAFFDTLRVYSY